MHPSTKPLGDRRSAGRAMYLKQVGARLAAMTTSGLGAVLQRRCRAHRWQQGTVLQRAQHDA